MTDLATCLGAAILVWIWLRLDRIAIQLAGVHEEIAALKRDLGLLPPLSDKPSDRVKKLAADAKTRIEAIRAYRQESGADLRRARAVVEQLGKSSDGA